MENELKQKKNECLISSLQKFSNGQKTFDMILASQKCILIRKGQTTSLTKIKKYFKNYFVKEASSFSPSTIYNLCGRGGHTCDNYPLRKSPHILQNSKLFWIPKGGKTNPLGHKKIWVPKVT